MAGMIRRALLLTLSVLLGGASVAVLLIANHRAASGRPEQPAAFHAAALTTPTATPLPLPTWTMMPAPSTGASYWLLTPSATVTPCPPYSTPEESRQAEAQLIRQRLDGYGAALDMLGVTRTNVGVTGIKACLDWENSGELLWIEVDFYVTGGLDHPAELGVLLELTINSTADWPTVPVSVRFRDADNITEQVWVWFPAQDGLALLGQDVHGADLYAELLRRTQTHRDARLTPVSPTPTPSPRPSPTLCPPNGTPERAMYWLTDALTHALWQQGLTPADVFVMGYQNCVTTMAPDALGFVSLDFAATSADERTYPAQLGQLLPGVIRALAEWPETYPDSVAARAEWAQVYVYLRLRGPAGSPANRFGMRFILSEARALLETGLTGAELYDAVARIEPDFGPYEYYLERYYYVDE